MANSELQVKARVVLGKKVAQLRRTGITPGNVFGHKIESTAVQADTAELTRLLKGMTRNAILNLKVDGEPAPRNVVIRAISRDPVSTQILHLDFYQVSMTEKMSAEVPIVLTGTSDAVTTFGGVLLQTLESISVEALPGDIPTQFVADVSQITQLEGAIHVRDLAIDETKLTLMTDPDVVVARVASPRVVVEETPAAVEGEVAPADAAGAPGAAPAAPAPPAAS
ncbi:MAG: 50S ribosomal protein L25 [Chloroflexota bacterium]|nr:50S ribosomal protein L25 [Chloroflexota bacterium]